MNGSPYCLRLGNFSLRNMRDVRGISGSRLELLEERLKADVLAELQSFGGRQVALCHSFMFLTCSLVVYSSTPSAPAARSFLSGKRSPARTPCSA